MFQKLPKLKKPNANTGSHATFAPIAHFHNTRQRQIFIFPPFCTRQAPVPPPPGMTDADMLKAAKLLKDSPNLDMAQLSASVIQHTATKDAKPSSAFETILANRKKLTPSRRGSVKPSPGVTKLEVQEMVSEMCEKKKAEVQAQASLPPAAASGQKEPEMQAEIKQLVKETFKLDEETRLKHSVTTIDGAEVGGLSPTRSSKNDASAAPADNDGDTASLKSPTYRSVSRSKSFSPEPSCRVTKPSGATPKNAGVIANVTTVEFDTPTHLTCTSNDDFDLTDADRDRLLESLDEQIEKSASKRRREVAERRSVSPGCLQDLADIDRKLEAGLKMEVQVPKKQAANDSDGGGLSELDELDELLDADLGDEFKKKPQPKSRPIPAVPPVAATKPRRVILLSKSRSKSPDDPAAIAKAAETAAVERLRSRTRTRSRKRDEPEPAAKVRRVILEKSPPARDGPSDKRVDRNPESTHDRSDTDMDPTPVLTAKNVARMDTNNEQAADQAGSDMGSASDMSF